MAIVGHPASFFGLCIEEGKLDFWDKALGAMSLCGSTSVLIWAILLKNSALNRSNS